MCVHLTSTIVPQDLDLSVNCSPISSTNEQLLNLYTTQVVKLGTRAKNYECLSMHSRDLPSGWETKHTQWKINSSSQFSILSDKCIV